jgi:D-alanyl-D-alanine endopeptidase (penicillin-binding protein 7)
MVNRLIVFLILLVTAHTFVLAKSTAQQTITYSLWNVDTGERITGDNEDYIRPIASMTKLMTVLVTIRENQDLAEELIVTGKERSTKIRTGMKITRQKLIELALISSDNLATRTLAENYPGGYTNFIAKMNETAKNLDMNNTIYADSTGLLSANTSSTDDIRKLILALPPTSIITSAANTIRLAFTATVTKKNKQQQVTIQGLNTNFFVGKLDIIAAKTGYTSSAGRCLTMLFNHNGSKYFLVVMGATSNEQRKKIVEVLLDKIK